MALPTEAFDRKGLPVVTGVLDYFPLAIAEVAKVSKAGNDQHNPGTPLHWDRTKSLDHADSLVRHLMERGQLDGDGQRHSAKVAWRALALLQTELEEANCPGPECEHAACYEPQQLTAAEEASRQLLSLTPEMHEAAFQAYEAWEASMPSRGPHPPTRAELDDLFGDEVYTLYESERGE